MAPLKRVSELTADLLEPGEADGVQRYAADRLPGNGPRRESAECMRAR